MLRNTSLADVAVVGAGRERARDGLGAAAARATTSSSTSSSSSGTTRGSSHGRTRIFRLAYPEAKWVRLAQEALAGWRELEARERGGAARSSTGCSSSSARASSARSRRSRSATRSASCSRARRRRERFGVAPAAGLRSCSSSRTRASCTPTGRAPRSRGACEIEENHRVESLDDLDEEVVVVTAGPVGAAAARPARHRPAGGRDPRDGRVLPARGPGPVGRRRGRHDGGHGFYSLADPVYGLKVGSHMRGKPADPDEAKGARPGARRRDRRVDARAVPRAPTPSRSTRRACFYTTTDDERFILERHGRIVVGSACSGHGFKFAPAVGKPAGGSGARARHYASPCRCTSASATSRASATSSSATTGRSSPRR